MNALSPRPAPPNPELVHTHRLALVLDRCISEIDATQAKEAGYNLALTRAIRRAREAMVSMLSKAAAELVIAELDADRAQEIGRFVRMLEYGEIPKGEFFVEDLDVDQVSVGDRGEREEKGGGVEVPKVDPGKSAVADASSVKQRARSRTPLRSNQSAGEVAGSNPAARSKTTAPKKLRLNGHVKVLAANTCPARTATRPHKPSRLTTLRDLVAGKAKPVATAPPLLPAEEKSKVGHGAMEITTTDTPAAICPHCELQLECATSIFRSTRPKPGGVTICFYCAGISVFTTDLSLRKPTAAESIVYAQDPRILQAQILASGRPRSS